jgi:type I restriction enzyme S subunit
VRIQNLKDAGAHLNRFDGEVREQFLIDSGQLLFAWSGTPGTSFGAHVWQGGPAVLNQHIFRIQFNEALIDKAFFRHAINHKVEELIGRAHGGVGLAHVTKGVFESTLIGLPPLAEQRRIVAKLDALTAGTVRARADLDRVPRLVSRYRQAVLDRAFSGELTPQFDRAEFAERPLSDVLLSTFYGPRFGKEAYVSTGTPTLRTTDFDDFGRIRLKGPPKVAVSARDYEKWGLRDGDLLVTRTGSIGKCAVYDEAMGPALPSAYLIRVRLSLKQVLPRYALLFLLSPSGQRQLGLGITAVTQPNINAGVIERLLLPVPSLRAQREIVDRLEAAFAEIDRLAAEAASARKLLDRLDQAILAKAFRGELVPQDLADEPASVLLDRIRAERADAPRVKRGRKPREAA